ncbi:MAG: response regulator, partial [Cyclobacteriaceae bacterium]|nr:response regulator [Cyclobacteriaceae bacterium HetDA_MAG_MS6]
DFDLQYRPDAMLIDRKGQLWIRDSNPEIGLIRYDSKSGKLTRIYNHSDQRNILGSNYIQDFILDKDDQLWLAHFKGGISVYTQRTSFFNHIFLTKGENLQHVNNVHAVLPWQQGVLLGSLNGLRYIDLENGNVKSYEESPYQDRRLYGRMIGALAEGPDNRIWVGYLDQHYSFFFPETGRFTHFDYELDNSVTSWSVQRIVPANDSIVYIGASTGGLVRFNVFTNDFHYYMPNPPNFSDPNPLASGNISDVYIRDMAIDPNENLWLVTSVGGVNFFNAKTAHFRVLDNELIVKHQHNYFNVFYDSVRNGLWLGTEGFGLDFYNIDQKAGYNVNTKHGLADNFVAGTVVDQAGDVWISTYDGLSRFEPKDSVFTNFGRASGMRDVTFNRRAIAINDHGEIFIGGEEGATYFHPKDIQYRATSDSVHFTEIQVNDQKIPVNRPFNGRIIIKEPLTKISKLSLKFFENDITINYSAIDLVALSDVRYETWLEGHEEDWVLSTYSRSFNELEPGTYTFHVRIIGQKPSANPSISSLDLIITPAWYKTMWFQLTLLTVILGAVYGFYKLRIRSLEMDTRRLNKLVAEKTKEIAYQKQQVENQAQELAKTNDLKTRFFTNVSHELGTPATLISVLAKELKQTASATQRKTVDVLEYNARKLTRLISNILDLRRYEYQVVDRHVMSHVVSDYFGPLMGSMTHLSQAKNVSFEHSLAEQSFSTDYDKLEEIVSNLLSNAIKYTNAGGHINCSMRLDGKKLLITVVDDGSGIAQEDQNKIFERFFRLEGSAKYGLGYGVGLSLVQEQVRVLEGTIELQSEKGFGSQFVVQLPHLEEDKPSSPSPRTLKDIDVTVLEEDSFPTERGLTEDEIQAKSDEEEPIILVVEDDNSLRWFLTEHLSELYTVIYASDGKRGLEMARHYLPDIMISDIMMPKMNGLELCQLIKSDELTLHIPVVLLTAKVGEENEWEGLSYGANDYITKPFNKEHLFQRIENRLKSQRALVERQRNLLFNAKNQKDDNTTKKQSEQTDPLLRQLTQILEDNLDNNGLDVELICKSVGIGRTSIYRKVKTLTGLSMNAFIKQYRFTRAKELLLTGKYTVTQVMYKIGYENIQYFSRLFSEIHGEPPSQVIER